MRLKLFRGATMAAAMTQVRLELGPDALILSTRRVATGVEVTAALEDAEEDTPAPLQADPGRRAALAFHGVPLPLAERLEHGALPDMLAATLRFTPLDLGAEARPLLLTGPPGAGKTLTTARLATRLVLAGIAPLVITADGRRAGATEQLAAFTRLLGLNLLVASNPVSLARALTHRRDRAPVLIDAPGCDPFDPAQRQELHMLSATAGATAALVLPAGIDTNEASEQAAAYAEAGASMLIATKLDMARRLGGVIAAGAVGLGFAEAGIGPGAADGLVPMTATLLADRLLRAPNARISRPEGPS